MFQAFERQSCVISKFIRLSWNEVAMLTLISYSAVNFGKALFPIFALALNLPEDFFDDKVKRTALSVEIF